MWIPTPIYEALPYLYILFGVLFFSGTAYIGLAAPGALVYICAGVFSTVYGAIIFAKRKMHRENSPKAGPIRPA
jgi:hypothetical protein